MKIAFATLAAALAATALPTVVQAQAAPAASVSYNLGVVSDYRYRGISQSRLNPALQGGADYSNPSGFYAGTWLSTISWIKDAGTIAGADTGSTPAEWDLYAGFKGELAKDLSYDVGGLYYAYLGNKIKNAGGANANTFEVYGALSYGLFTAKYSHALTNTFGFTDSKGSGYLDLSANIDLGSGFTLTPHIGRQEIKNFSAASYTDYSLTLGKDMGGGISVSAMLVGTDADKNGYVTPQGKFTGRNGLVLGAKFSF